MQLLVSLNILLRPFTAFMASFNVLPCFWCWLPDDYFNTGIALARRQPASLLLRHLFWQEVLTDSKTMLKKKNVLSQSW